MTYSVLTPEYFRDNPPMQQEQDGRWRPAKPYRYVGFINDLKLAWLVLRHRAEAITWGQ